MFIEMSAMYTPKIMKDVMVYKSLSTKFLGLLIDQQTKTRVQTS